MQNNAKQIIVDQEVVNYMSVIIGICGHNFAALWADTRMMQYKEDQVGSFRDDAIKIFQLNDRVLFGAAGFFLNGETLRDAVSGLENLDKASIKVCKDCVISFLKSNQCAGRVLPLRNYILAGKQRDGTFIMYSIHWDPVVKKAKVEQYYPYGNDMKFGVVAALPQAPAQFQKDCTDNAYRLIAASKTYNDLDLGIKTLISEIAKRNPTASPKAMSLRIL